MGDRFIYRAQHWYRFMVFNGAAVHNMPWERNKNGVHICKNLHLRQVAKDEEISLLISRAFFPPKLESHEGLNQCLIAKESISEKKIVVNICSTKVSWPSLSLNITAMFTVRVNFFVQKERHRPWGFALYTGLNIDTDSWCSMEQQYITCPGKEIKMVSIYVRIYIWGRLQKMKRLVCWLVGLFSPQN